MSDGKKRFRAILNALKKLYPWEPKGRLVQQLTVLVALISGIVGSQKSHLSSIADKIGQIGRESELESRVKRFSRWIGNERITLEIHFLHFGDT